jgi:hypothetical protein
MTCHGVHRHPHRQDLFHPAHRTRAWLLPCRSARPVQSALRDKETG